MKWNARWASLTGPNKGEFIEEYVTTERAQKLMDDHIHCHIYLSWIRSL
jgi:hypothetical protein